MDTIVVTKKNIKTKKSKKIIPTNTPKKNNETTSYLPSPNINMTFIEEGQIDPHEIKLDLIFQRDEELARKNNLLETYNILGMYDQNYPVVLDQNFGCVDGLHRTKLGRSQNLPLIPYKRFHFKTELDKIKYFHVSQRQTHGMTARDELYSYSLTQHAYAELLYSLCGENAPTLFSSCSDLKMGKEHKMSNSNIKVVHLCYILNNIVLGIKSGWGRTHANNLYKKSTPHLNKKSFKINCEKMDDFLNFFLESTGHIISKKDLRFKEHFILAFIELYTDHLLIDVKFKVDKERERIEKILQKYRIIPEVVTNHKVVIVEKLLKEINGTKHAKNCYI